MKRLAKEILIAVVIATVMSLVVILWMVWPSLTSAKEVSGDYIPSTRTVCVTHTVHTGESITGIVKNIIEENGLEINPDVLTQQVCFDNSIPSDGYIYEGQEIMISYPIPVEKESGN